MLYRGQLLLVFSYSKENFEGNQLLGGSISLSPLLSNHHIDLRVRMCSVLHHNFSWLQPVQQKFAAFRVQGFLLLDVHFQINSFMTPWSAQPLFISRSFTYLYLLSLRIKKFLFTLLHRTNPRLLSPCSKTGDKL